MKNCLYACLYRVSGKDRAGLDVPYAWFCNKLFSLTSGRGMQVNMKHSHIDL